MKKAPLHMKTCYVHLVESSNAITNEKLLHVIKRNKNRIKTLWNKILYCNKKVTYMA